MSKLTRKNRKWIFIGIFTLASIIFSTLTAYYAVSLFWSPQIDETIGHIIIFFALCGISFFGAVMVESLM